MRPLRCILLERLQKIIARAGIASRREAELLITDGKVTVNGEIITELGAKADPSTDHIKVNGKLIQIDENLMYLLLNKPRGVVSTVHDPEGRPTVTDLFPDIKSRIYPVGRLDFNTEGVMLLTNDGNLTHKLLAPKSKCPKTYMVKVAGLPDPKTIQRLQRGITVDGNRYGSCEIEILKKGSNTWLRVVLTEGKNHQIKNMFEIVGHPVSKLRRIAFAFLTSKGLKPGEWRHLTDIEVERLKRGDYEFLMPINPFKYLREVGVGLRLADYEAYRAEKGIPEPIRRPGRRPPQSETRRRTAGDASGSRDSGRSERRPENRDSGYRSQSGPSSENRNSRGGDRRDGYGSREFSRDERPPRSYGEGGDRNRQSGRDDSRSGPRPERREGSGGFGEKPAWKRDRDGERPSRGPSDRGGSRPPREGSSDRDRPAWKRDRDGERPSRGPSDRGGSRPPREGSSDRDRPAWKRDRDGERPSRGPSDRGGSRPPREGSSDRDRPAWKRDRDGERPSRGPSRKSREGAPDSEKRPYDSKEKRYPRKDASEQRSTQGGETRKGPGRGKFSSKTGPGESGSERRSGGPYRGRKEESGSGERDSRDRKPSRFKAKAPQKAWSKSLDRKGGKGSSGKK